MDCKKPKNADSKGKQKVVLVGNPNVGKSVLFGLLTGTYATVSNYPGTTVEVSRGPAKVRGKSFHIIDSPGVNGLLPTSEDEQVTRDILLVEEDAVVLNVLDSKNLRRALLVTTQLAEAKKPVLLSLNMYDEAGEKGIKIDHSRLSKELGCTVVPTIATQRWGFDKLKDSFLNASVPNVELRYPPAIEGGLLAITGLIPESGLSKRSMALMLLSGDSTLDIWQKENLEPEVIKQIKTIRLKAEGVYSEPIGYIINKERHRFVDSLIRKIITVEPKAKGPVSEFIGKWAMHPVGGLFILAAVLFAMYEFVGVLGAGHAVDFLETHVFGEYLNPWATRMANATIPGGWAGELTRDLLVGEYGLITMALTYAVAIILPIVGFFFIFFGLLEDSGYLPRLAVMVDRVFKLMGLNGKAVLPMILGLGCATMATMTTRMLETKKERIIVTLLLALGIPCSAQLGVILGMLGSISLVATLWWGGTVLLTLFLVAWLSSKIVPGECSDFILEIPPMRLPKLSNIALKTLVRVEWYLKEAVPLFILGTFVLFILDRLNLLLLIERITAPIVVGLLELPPKATEAFLIGFLRRDYGAAGLFSLQKDGLLDPTQVVVSLVTMTLFVPCIANFFMIIKERGAKAAVMMAVFIFPFALLVGGLLNFIIRLVNPNL